MYNKIKYSFVVPIYNDGYLISAFCTEFEKVFKKYLNTSLIENDVELIFVNDGSSDNSLDLLKECAKNLNFIKVINLSRNFGQHIAILCGYKHASGSFIGRLNVDMQDPPDQIPKLIRELVDSSYDMIVGIQPYRKSSFIDIITARLFFWFFNFLIGSKIPQNTSSLRVMRRHYVDALLLNGDKNPFLQGLEHSIGFHVGYSSVKHRKRVDHRTSYSLAKRFRLAFNAAVSFSDRPLKCIIYIGFFAALVGFFGILYLISTKFLFPNILPGFTSTLASIFFFAGLQISVTGLCGIYIGKILFHVQDRPLFIVKEFINFPLSIKQ